MGEIFQWVKQLQGILGFKLVCMVFKKSMLSRHMDFLKDNVDQANYGQNILFIPNAIMSTDLKKATTWPLPLQEPQIVPVSPSVSFKKQNHGRLI